MAKDATQDLWPRWPAGHEHPVSLVDIRVKLDVDKLFQLLYAPGSEYVAQSQEVRGNKEYVETPWVSDMTELADAELVPPPPHSKAAQMNFRGFEGRLRKTSCLGSSMGMKFKAEEVQRCVKGIKGKSFEVEVCVATTATYGDKFRVVCRHRLQAEDPEWSTWKVDFALVYIQPVNGLLKRAIEKGSASGLAKNFATLVEILGTFAEVQVPGKEVPLQTARAPSAQAAGVPAADAWLGGLLNTSLVQVFDSVATSLGLSAGRGSILATGMAVAVLLLVLEGVLDTSGWVLGLFGISPAQLSVPANMLTVVTSLLLFKLAQVAIVYAAAGVRWANATVRRNWGAPRATSTPAGEGDQDIPTAGTRFDGFDAALENASADIASAEHGLRQAGSHASALLSPHSSARTQLRSGVKGLQRLVADTWTAGRRAVASGALSPDRAVSPPPQRLSASPPAQADSGDEAGLLSDDASPGGSARMSKRKARRIARSRSPTKDSESAIQAHAVELSALGPKALSFTSQTSSQQSAEERGVVEAEVFENERFLPFRGWGHEWPGHLLPTDRVGHWSLRGDRPSGAESMDFHRVAPPLPKGWQWLDEDWHIDMTGHEDACVDNEGWYYAVDFNWLKHPPAPASGRFKRVRDYVRRRRWVRTRVRDDNAALAGSALRQLSTMSSLPPPLLPLAELLGDSIDVLPSAAISAQEQEQSDQQRAGSSSRRASGSGEHRDPSRAASISLDCSSGKAGSQLPTPRLMYSTSRGLSLQESGVELCDMLVRLQLDVSEDLDRPVSISILKRQDTAPADNTLTQAARRLPRAEHPRDGAPGLSARGKASPVAAQTAALPRPVVARQTPAQQQPPQPAQGPTQGSAFARVAKAEREFTGSGTTQSVQSHQGVAAKTGSAVQQHASEENLQEPEALSTANASQHTSAGGMQPRALLIEQEVHASLSPSISDDSSPPAAGSHTPAADPSHEAGHPASDQALATLVSDRGAQHARSHSAAAGTAAPTDGDKADAGTSTKPALKGLTVPKAPAGGRKQSSAAPSPTAGAAQSAAAPDQAAVHGGALSDDEALSPSALSESLEFGGRVQQGSVRDSNSHAGHVDWNELGKRSSRLAALAGEGLRKGLRDMQHHAARQTSGRKEPDGFGGPDSAATSQADVENHPRRPDTPPMESSNTFLQSLKTRGEQSLNAARSALSPEAGRQHEGQIERAPAHGKDGQPGIGPSVRGMFSDLKRTMERVGASPLIQGASTLGRRESSSSLREGLDHAISEAAAEKQPQHIDAHPDMHVQPLPEGGPAVEAAHSLEEQCKSISESHSRRSSERGDGTPEVLSADEWGDFDFDHT